MNEPARTFAEIDDTLRARGIHLDADSEDFLDGNRPLDLDELLNLLPNVTEDEICAYAETRWTELRHQPTGTGQGQRPRSGSAAGA